MGGRRVRGRGREADGTGAGRVDRGDGGGEGGLPQVQDSGGGNSVAETL